MLRGFKFSLRLESVKLQLFIPENKIVREHKLLPNFEFDLSILGVFVDILDQNVIVRVLLKEIKVNDFFRKDIRRTLTHFNTSS